MILILFVLSYVCRYYTTDDIEEGARRTRREYRCASSKWTEIRSPEKEVYRFIVIQPSFLSKYDEGLCKEVYSGKLPWKFRGPYADQLSMRSFFKSISEEFIQKTEKPILDNTSGGAPVLDYLVHDYEQNHGGFAYPALEFIRGLRNCRATSNATLDSFHVMEVTLGESSDRDIVKAIQFFDEKLSGDQNNFPSRVVSVDLQSILITADDMKKLPSLKGGRQPEMTYVSSPSELTKSKMFPAKLILGGKNWALCVRTNIGTVRNPDGSVGYYICNKPVQPQLVTFLRTIPIAVGFGIERHLNDMESLIQTLGAPGFKFVNHWIDISSVAVVAGFHSKELTMFNINFQILGGILCKNNLNADGLWSLAWNELPDEFKLCAVANVRSICVSYIVLLSSLLRNLFPDPEICCLLTGRPQLQVVEWFAKFIAGILDQLVVDMAEYSSARTREELVLCLKQAGQVNTEVSSSEVTDIEIEIHAEASFEAFFEEDQPPNKIAKLAKIIPFWPTVVFGSSCFLHSTRKFACEQARVLSQLDVPGVLNIWQCVDLSDKNISNLLYGQEITDDKPMNGTESGCLAPDPYLKYPVANIDPNTVLNSQITQIAKAQQRSARLILLEWTRLNDPKYTELLLLRASEFGGPDRKARFWFGKLSKYEEMRMSYFYVTGVKPSVSCGWAEKRLEDHLLKNQRETGSQIAMLESQLANAKKRQADLSNLEAAGSGAKRVRLQEVVACKATAGCQLTEAQRERRRRRNQARRKKRGASKCGNRQNSDDVDAPASPMGSSSSGVNAADVAVTLDVHGSLSNDFRSDVYGRVVTDFANAYPAF